MMKCVLLAGLVAVLQGAEEDLMASEQVPGLEIPAGTVARVVADHEHQGVTSPTALTEDEQGRWFVAETVRFRSGVEDNRDHDYWLMDDATASTTADRSAMYQKWKDKFPAGYFTEKSERIRALANPGEEGVFTKSEVYAEGFNGELDGTAAGIFAYDDVVFFACIPKITTLADRDGDLKADQRAVLQDGFGVRVSYSGHDMNGFTLGPDGRIWGTIGDRGFAITTREGKRFEFPDRGAVFRFEPDGSDFQVVHTGLRNPKEIDFDAHGNPITVDNNADQGDRARIVYIVEGGDSGWRMGQQLLMSFGKQIGAGENAPAAWMAEKRWELQNDEQPAFMLPPVAYLTSGPSGLAYHPGTGFLEAEKGRFAVCDYRGGAATSGVWSFRLAEKGSSMELVDARKLVWGLTATDVAYSWDGRLMVADFEGGWVSHDAGRLVEVSAADRFRGDAADEVVKAMREGLEDVESKQLAAWLNHPDMRLRIRAELELTRRPDGPDILSQTALRGEGLARLHAIWGIGVYLRRGAAVKPTVETDEFMDVPGSSRLRDLQPVLVKLVEDPDPEIRAQAAKVLGEIGGVADRANFASLILDENPRVQMYGTLAAGRARAIGSLSFVWQMLAEKGATDPYLLHAGSMALQAMSSVPQLVSLSREKSPAVRLAAVDALGRLKDKGVAGFLNDADPRVFEEVIRMIHDGGIEAARPALFRRSKQGISAEHDEMTWRRLIHNALHLGGNEELEWVSSLPLNDDLSLAVRKEALHVLAQWDEPSPVDGASGNHQPPVMDGRAKVASVLTGKVPELVKAPPEVLEAAIRLIGTLGLDDSAVPAAGWMALVENTGLPPGARVAALDRWIARKLPQRDQRLSEIAAGDDDALALAALGRLAELAPEAAEEGIRQSSMSDDPARRKVAWETAEKIGGEAMAGLMVDGLERLGEAHGKDAAGLELLQAAEASGSPQVARALESYREKTAGDPLAGWLVCEVGGDPDSGRELFFSDGRAQCAKCHRVGGDHGVGEAGPDLEGVAGRGDRHYFLESMILPGAKVAAGFGMVTATLRDGKIVGGLLMKNDDASVEIDVAGERRTFSHDEVVELSDPLSVMPPMGSILNRAEIRDLVAWLATLDKSE
ncbi:DUF7133 domain-containing protein [Haloferula sargassicola]|uniref:Cytochrome c domain-containing protein n=1 Tax=Haloferula sargassicola TaxID=490096 RepID=A0ABP9UR08_9BACT